MQEATLRDIAAVDSSHYSDTRCCKHLVMRKHLAVVVDIEVMAAAASTAECYLS